MLMKPALRETLYKSDFVHSYKMNLQYLHTSNQEVILYLSRQENKMYLKGFSIYLFDKIVF